MTSRDQSPDRSSNLAGDEQRPAIFDLVLDLVDASSGFHGWLAYSADLFDQDTMRRMAEHLVILIQGAIRDPRRHLSDLPLLSAAERGTLLVDWNATLRSVPDQPGLSASFDDMAARFPDAPAFFCNGEQLTYAQLRRKVDRLASALRQHDVGPGSLVAICVHRSFAAIVALMAVMKAGGAYVPLDPAYPRDRLAFMLDDAAVEIAITAGAAADTLEAIIRNSGRKLRTIDIDDLDDSPAQARCRTRSHTRRLNPLPISSPTSSTHRALRGFPKASLSNTGRFSTACVGCGMRILFARATSALKRLR